MDDVCRIPVRKIDPYRGAVLGDGLSNDNDRMEIGPTRLAYSEWEEAGLELPDVERMRTHRWRRLTRHIVERDYGGLLLFDPLNIRYATDSTNMQLWNAHNPFRAVLLCADGYMVIFEYKNSKFLTDFNPLVQEVRTGASMFYFAAGDLSEKRAADFAGQVDQIMSSRVGSNRRLAIDKIMPVGLRAIERAGFDAKDGEEVTEKSRSVKGKDEILAMRCASHACEAAVKEMHLAAIPGQSENDIWAVLHAGNIRRGGEWVETRLLATGPRTNPWFQECGPRMLQIDEILAFDTDLVGCYGICVDISRTWWVGDGQPRPDMIYAMRHAHEHIMTNMDMLAPGVSFRELIMGGHQLDPQFEALKYGCKMHGVGLCDEWPHICYADAYQPGGFDYVLEPGMVLCVEALVGTEGGDFSIKLEDQVLITDSGYENLTSYPFDERLMGLA